MALLAGQSVAAIRITGYLLSSILCVNNLSFYDRFVSNYERQLMRTVTIVVLKSIIVLALAGTVVVLAGVVPAFWRDLSHSGAENWERNAFTAIVVASIVTMQVFAVCVWRLLTLVRRGSVFSPAAFGYVNTLIGTFVAASTLALLLAILLAPGGVAPGLVGLICGAALVLAGLALLVSVMRHLLKQAIDYQSEAQSLRSELDEVI